MMSDIDVRQGETEDSGDKPDIASWRCVCPRPGGQLLRVRSVVQEPCDPASLLQSDEVRENTIQFPNNPRTSDELPNMTKGVTV